MQSLLKLVFTWCLIFLYIINGFSQPSTSSYSRDGAQATMKNTNELFKDPFLFKKGELNLSGNQAENKTAILQALAESDKIIKDYEEKILEFTKSKPTAIVVKNAFLDVVHQVSGLSGAIDKAAEGYSSWRSLSAVSFMQKLYLYRSFITGAMKVYPESISLEEKLELVNTAIAKYGTREAYMLKMEKNQQEYLKNLRMKKAVFIDATVEAMVKKEYESIWETEKIKVTKVHITSNWVLEKNVLDIPLYKEVEVNMAIKKQDGTCAIASGYVRATYEGGGKYGGPVLIMPTHPIVLACENVNK